MKRLTTILFLLTLVAVPLLTRADDYIDDVYYSPEVVIQSPAEQPKKPYYNKNLMQEIIFLDDDTAATQMPDTVRAIIKR